MVAIESAEYYVWAEGACGIETASGEVDARQFSHEKSQADADGREESALVLFRSQHEHCENEHGGQEHLDKETPDNRRIATQRCSNFHLVWEEGGYNASGGYSSDDLGDEYEAASGPAKTANEA